MHNSEGAVSRPTPRSGDTGTRSSLATLGRLNPEWRPWLDLVDLALEMVDDPVWSEAHLELAPSRAPMMPLLHGATISVDLQMAEGSIHELLRRSAPHLAHDPVFLEYFDPYEIDVLALLQAAVMRESEWFEAVVGESSLDLAGLHAVAQLALWPLLLNSARWVADQLSNGTTAGWSNGYCPICGAWPVIAELRGLKKTRHLRCGSCSGDWTLPILHCPFCDEVDHAKLGGLVVDGEEEKRKIEVCHTCNGYIKTVATLGPLPATRMAVIDLEMIEHEIAALERGFHRPEGPGIAIELEILPAKRGRNI